jgi:hypothetical protein
MAKYCITYQKRLHNGEEYVNETQVVFCDQFQVEERIRELKKDASVFHKTIETFRKVD